MGVDSKLIERTIWIDVCKGMCIVLVVYGHISGGLEAAGKLAPDSVWIGLRDWVYLFHMPAFFALSGMFACKLTLIPPRDFLLGRLRTLFFPYLVWTAIIVVAQLAMVRFINHPPELSRLWFFLLEPYGYGLWFLYALFIISVLFYFLARLRISPLIIVLLAATLSSLASLNIFGFWPVLNTAMSFFIYYAGAACARDRIISIFSRHHWLPSLLSGFGLLLVLALLCFAGLSMVWPVNLLLAGLGIAGVVLLAKGLARTLASRFWAFLGLFSLEIYLGHPLWGTIGRVVLFKWEIHSSGALVFGCLLFGIGGSLIIGVLCRRMNFPFLFRWPAPAGSARSKAL